MIRLETLRFACATALVIAPTITLGETADHSFDCVIKPREIVELGSAAEGVLVERLVRRGSVVEAGQPVARLDDSRQQIRLQQARLAADRDIEIQSRRAQVVFQESELARIENLAINNLTPTVQVERARLELEIARFAYDAAVMDKKSAEIDLEAALDALERRTVRSSVTGVVTDTDAAPGAFIGTRSTIMTIAKLDVLNVDVFLPTALYGLLQPDITATVVPEDPIGGQYTGVIETVDQVFDAASGTFGVRLTLENPEITLPAGLRCTVKFSPGTK